MPSCCKLLRLTTDTQTTLVLTITLSDQDTTKDAQEHAKERTFGMQTTKLDLPSPAQINAKRNANTLTV